MCLRLLWKIAVKVVERRAFYRKGLRNLAVFLLIATGSTAVDAQAEGGSAGITVSPEIPLYGKGGAERENWSAGVGERTIRNVTRPTLTAVLPPVGSATGEAVVIAPGGAFLLLMIDKEGFAVARALAARGIVAFVLKYRLQPTPVDDASAYAAVRRRLSAGIDPNGPGALRFRPATDDVAAALALVQAKSATYGVDPSRVGVVGFSAGAIAALDATLILPAAKRPAFLGYIYGPQSVVTVPLEAPPLFDAIAADDPLFPIGGLELPLAWIRAGQLAELHVFERGGHGFGLGESASTNTLLADSLATWIKMERRPRAVQR